MIEPGKPTSVWWWPTPREGEVVPDYPPSDITSCIAEGSFDKEAPMNEAEIRADERRKVCREEGHNPVETTGLGELDLSFNCCRCGHNWSEPRTRPVKARALVFGRGPNVDVPVNDPYASPRHCRVVNVGDRWYVEDLGSTNGTFVLRDRMSIKVGGPLFLHPGDQIRIGRTTLPWSVPS